MKSREEIMEILEAFDLTESFRDAGELAGGSSSPTPTAPGSAARTRTRMASCASTSPRAPIWRAGSPTSSQLSKQPSTHAHGRSSDGRHQPKPSIDTYAPCKQPVLLRSIEPGQYTSWAFGRRLHEAGLLGSMGSIGDCFDNSVAESFFGTLQIELLDEHTWTDRDHLAAAIFDWIEAWYNPRRRHSYCRMLSPVDYETAPRGMIYPTPNPSAEPGGSSVTMLAFGPDGTMLASASRWHGEVVGSDDGESIGKPLTGHTDSVWGVAFSPDGTRAGLRQRRWHGRGVGRRVR